MAVPTLYLKSLFVVVDVEKGYGGVLSVLAALDMTLVFYF